MFTTEELKYISAIARLAEDESTVYKTLVDIAVGTGTYPDPFEGRWHIIKYCTEECERQGSGPESVYDMINAWDYAHNARTADMAGYPGMVLEFIENIGKLVEPVDNQKGFRTIPIYVGNGWDYVEKALWWRVPELLENLIISYYEGRLGQTEREVFWPEADKPPYRVALTPEDEFYYEYENIHPFRDGNGRSGKILYNYLKGTLDNPVMPPNFFGGSNP